MSDVALRLSTCTTDTDNAAGEKKREIRKSLQIVSIFTLLQALTNSADDQISFLFCCFSVRLLSDCSESETCPRSIICDDLGVVFCFSGMCPIQWKMIRSAGTGYFFAQLHTKCFGSINAKKDSKTSLEICLN